MSRALNVAVPVEVLRAAAMIKEFAAQRDPGDNWSVYGLGPAFHRDARIAELEAAIDKLAQCKGRFHTEANFKALIEVRNKSLHK